MWAWIHALDIDQNRESDFKASAGAASAMGATNHDFHVTVCLCDMFSIQSTELGGRGVLAVMGDRIEL